MNNINDLPISDTMKRLLNAPCIEDRRIGIILLREIISWSEFFPYMTSYGYDTIDGTRYIDTNCVIKGPLEVQYTLWEGHKLFLGVRHYWWTTLYDNDTHSGLNF